MAFRTADLSVLAYANEFTLWSYRTKDAGFPPGYFDPAHAMLRDGDIILAIAATGACILLVAGNKDEEILTQALSGTAWLNNA